MLTTKLNRPNQESEHAGEERDYSTNGGRHTGNSRLAAAGGNPYTNPNYTPPQEENDNAPEIDENDETEDEGQD